MKNHSQILQAIFRQALSCDDSQILLPEEIKKNLHFIADQASLRKGVFTVLTTLIIHKIYAPGQDIRKHQSHMKNGFSGRSIDTQYITPTLKKLKLPAMAETGWLTRSLEQPHPFNLKYPGKIQNKTIKLSFLNTIDYIQKNPNKARYCIIYLMHKVQKKYLNTPKFMPTLSNQEKINIEKTVSFLEECFNHPYRLRGGSKLPVIAFHSLFTILIKELSRYKNCQIKPLGSHFASDKTSKVAGDIEIINSENQLQEAVEIKFNRKIDAHLIRIIEDKIHKYKPKRYCVFSTKPIENKKEVSQIVSNIRKTYGCQIILNGVLPTFKYYLRLISSLEEFIRQFIGKVHNDSELQVIHKKTVVRLAGHVSTGSLRVKNVPSPQKEGF